MIKANPTLENYIIEQPPNTVDKLELRRGGEMAERLGAVSGEVGEPLRVASTYANEGPIAGYARSPSSLFGSRPRAQLLAQLNEHL